MEVQHLGQLSAGSDRDVAVGPASAPALHVARRVPCCGRSAVEVLQQRRQIYLEGTGLSRRTRWISGLQKKTSTQCLVSARSLPPHHLDSSPYYGGTWPRPNDDMAQSRRLLRDRMSRPMGSKKSSPPGATEHCDSDRVVYVSWRLVHMVQERCR